MNTPREKISLASAYFLLLFAGTIGLHQFFLRNWKRGVALLATTGLSQICFFDLFHTGAVHKLLGDNLVSVFLLGGALIGIPLFIWDAVTLKWQLKKYNERSEQDWSSKKIKRIFFLISLVYFCIFSFYFFRAVKIDSCLDSGGCWDEDAKMCRNHQESPQRFCKQIPQ